MVYGRENGWFTDGEMGRQKEGGDGWVGEEAWAGNAYLFGWDEEGSLVGWFVGWLVCQSNTSNTSNTPTTLIMGCIQKLGKKVHSLGIQLFNHHSLILILYSII